MGIFFLAMGIWGITSPYSWWLIGESWKSKDADGPSTFFIKSTRIIAIPFIIVGFIGISDAFK
ncbi:DUF6199 family natural product biosynthesis protein [Halobacillus litoralis]|uniref:DUF6199 family natural product biosynthesis protein n=1 Tax=Halobacillus litoralis TaxID=45668 RepID=UPI00249399D4|nr:DUF6199 family natural product biosynthesis protein [Halobacillus litoralis]